MIMPSIFDTEEAHIGRVNTKNDTKFEKRTRMRNLFRDKIQSYTGYLIFKGNPFDTTRNKNIIVVSFTQKYLLWKHYDEYFIGCWNSSRI
jgi:hypothetical protein